MTSLNFLLSRTLARTLARGDEIVVTGLDHDANVSPWLELAQDLGVVVRFARFTDDLRLDLADLERQLSPRTRVVAFPVASNAVGTLVDVRGLSISRTRRARWRGPMPSTTDRTARSTFAPGTSTS